MLLQYSSTRTVQLADYKGTTAGEGKWQNMLTHLNKKHEFRLLSPNEKDSANLLEIGFK